MNELSPSSGGDGWPTAARAPTPPRLPASAAAGRREAAIHRTTVHASDTVTIEAISVAPCLPVPSGYETRHQIVLPYVGLITYRVGTRDWLLDANTMLFVSPDREYSDSLPVDGIGHASIILSPSENVLQEVCRSAGPVHSSAFRDATRPATPRSRLMTQQLLQLNDCADPLHKDEWTIRVLAELLSASQPRSGVRSKVVDRAKEVLHARSCERLRLEEIAREVGVTGVYLTQEFTRCEGTPLYRYQLQLRLGRSLLELAHCDDITGLALDLGFSSHSHFTSVFRNMFGVTPSQYRASCVSRHHVRH